MTDGSDEETPLAIGPLGMRLLAFERLPEDSVFDEAPVAYALVALWNAGRLLMVNVRDRGCWELPGGGIDPGESAREAAVRELWEESGQSAAPEALRFVGFARTSLPDRRVLRGALYQAEAAEPVAFAPTDEIAAIHWWNLEDPLAGGRVQTVDAYLAALARG
ncbi:NUDIX hydrolase [Streptomyces radicis]|uniref:NUDIX domain-containing protein n=1 Tax=Streptomyces radicis TaxID=1750517 RepID=A0A3A9W7X3_9ACTN|nr:NUDIX domain-containing protein [Streptomyces radicis]RKN08960.1 NUDIX domain-containing protein [Streptomyces radicis]RKN22849.1 NUDIX domain-containing protein [Streptomyces radicis]